MPFSIPGGSMFHGRKSLFEGYISNNKAIVMIIIRKQVVESLPAAAGLTSNQTLHETKFS